jgi:hypothetical protein
VLHVAENDCRVPVIFRVAGRQFAWLPDVIQTPLLGAVNAGQRGLGLHRDLVGAGGAAELFDAVGAQGAGAEIAAARTERVRGLDADGAGVERSNSPRKLAASISRQAGVPPARVVGCVWNRGWSGHVGGSRLPWRPKCAYR